MEIEHWHSVSPLRCACDGWTSNLCASQSSPNHSSALFSSIESYNTSGLGGGQQQDEHSIKDAGSLKHEGICAV